MLTVIAAAGFPVDGAEQVVSSRWARTRRPPRPVDRIQLFPDPPGR